MKQFIIIRKIALNSEWEIDSVGLLPTRSLAEAAIEINKIRWPSLSKYQYIAELEIPENENPAQENSSQKEA